MSWRSKSDGQASVELLAVLPLIAAVALLGVQLVVAGHAWWKLSEEARMAAREDYVKRGDGSVRLSRRVPLIVPFDALSGPRITVRSRFAP